MKAWYKDDSVPVYVVAIILAVLSIVQIVSLNKTYEAVKQSDILAQCFTPGTKCAEISAKSQIHQANVRTAGFRCLIASRPGSFAGRPLDELYIEYDNCVTEQLKKLED